MANVLIIKRDLHGGEHLRLKSVLFFRSHNQIIGANNYYVGLVHTKF